MSKTKETIARTQFKIVGDDAPLSGMDAFIAYITHINPDDEQIKHAAGVWEAINVVDDFHRKVYENASANGGKRFDMSFWRNTCEDDDNKRHYACKTTLCRGGWAIVVAGVGENSPLWECPPIAANAAYLKNYPDATWVPDFTPDYSDDVVLADMKALADGDKDDEHILWGVVLVERDDFEFVRDRFAEINKITGDDSEG